MSLHGASSSLFPLEKGLPGLIFELKAAKKRNESLDRLADEALRQIIQKKYEADMRVAGIQEIRKIGMAFREKEIEVKETLMYQIRNLYHDKK